MVGLEGKTHWEDSRLASSCQKMGKILHGKIASCNAARRLKKKDGQYPISYILLCVYLV